MGKIRVGSKENSFINGEWRAHAGDTWLKRWTSKKRRRLGKKDIKERQNDL
jgi:hypothetical protein